MKKLTKAAFAAALAFAFLMAACAKTGAQTLNSANALKQYLDNQPANTPDKPIRVAMGANEMMLKDIMAAINSSGKYVSLELTGSALTAIPRGAFASRAALVGLALPNSVTSIELSAFEGCTGLASVTIPDSVTSIERAAFMECASLASVTFQGRIPSSGLNEYAFYGQGDLRTKYLAGGPGTYTRPNGNSETWTKR